MNRTVVATLLAVVAPVLMAAGAEEIRSGLTVSAPGANPLTSSPAVSLKSLDVTVEIQGLLARTTVTKVLKNDGPEAVKAAFSFPLPADAAVDRFSMTVLNENELVSGVVQSRSEAKSAFRRTVDDNPATGARLVAAGAATSSGSVVGGGMTGAVALPLMGGSTTNNGSNVGERTTAPAADGASTVAQNGYNAEITSNATPFRSSIPESSSPGRITPPSESQTPDQGIGSASGWVATDPGIVELTGRSACRTTVFPIEPGRTKTVVISYVQTLATPATSTEKGTLHYSFPLSPFECAATPKTRTRLISRTDGVPGTMAVNGVLNPKLARGQNDDVTASVELEGRDALKGDWTIALESRAAKKTWDAGCAVQAHRPDPLNPGAFAVTLVPGAAAAVKPLNVVFVVDASSNRTAVERELACEFVNGAIAHLPADAQYDVLSMDRSLKAVHGSWTKPSAENARFAAAALRQSDALGSADAVTAFRELSVKYQKSDDRDMKVVFIGDIGGSAAERQLIHKTAGATLQQLNAELFAVRPCSRPELSEAGAAELLKLAGTPATEIVPGMNAARSGHAFAAALSTPVIRNASVSVVLGNGKAATLAASDASALVCGRAATLFGTYNADGIATVTLKGTLEGRPYRQDWVVTLPEQEYGNAAIARMQARACSDASDNASGFDAAQTVLKNQIVSRTSCFLVLENDKFVRSFDEKKDGSERQSELQFGKSLR